MTDPTNNTAKQQDSQPENSDQQHQTKEENTEKAKDFKVLHKDGSLADLPYNNEPGGGPLEGTVGIGT